MIYLLLSNNTLFFSPHLHNDVVEWKVIIIEACYFCENFPPVVNYDDPYILEMKIICCLCDC